MHRSFHRVSQAGSSESGTQYPVSVKTMHSIEEIQAKCKNILQRKTFCKNL